MKMIWLIFLLAFFIRFLNLLFLDLNIENYIIEDQKFYWEWSLKGAYFPWSELSPSLLTERMPGSFWFFKSLQWLTGNDLFLVLTLQSFLDSLTCVVLFLCAGLINKKYQLYTGLFASFSPLMVIICSQILSDTIFLFTFTLSLYFLLRYSNTKNQLFFLYLGALFLGISTFIRAATFPLIFICLPIVFLVIKNKHKSYLKTSINLFVFFIVSIAPISNRLVDNILDNNTYSLTSQTGSHVAYWMVPGVLSISQGMDRESSVKLVNEEIAKLGGVLNEPYKDSNIRIRASLNILQEEKIYYITYAWIRSSVLNIISSPILIDYRVRSLPHPSFAEKGNIIKWFNEIINNKKYYFYLFILLITLIFSIFSIYSLFFGYFVFFKSNLYLSIMSILIITYFCLITGPTISPKYSLPFLPILIYLQAISLEKLFFFVKNRT